MNKTTKRTPSSAPGFTSVAAQLLLRRGGREAANGDSLEFFSDLRKCQPEPRVSGQTERGGPGRPEDGRGVRRRRGSSDELLSSEVGKHDYDWLLTPPATPLCSPARSSSGHQISTAAPNQLPRAGSASYAKSNSRLGRPGQEKEKATSRLARSSSAAQSSSFNTAAIASLSGHLPRLRTLSSASVSSINTAGSNASVSSTSLVSAASSPRTPVTARSTARPCRQDRTSGKQATGPVVARQSRAWSSSKSRTGHPTLTCSRRDHATPSAVSSPRSTTSTTYQQVPPTPSKRASAVARSRLASQSGGTGSTARASSSSTTTSQPPRDVHLTRGARALPSTSRDGVNTRAVPAAVKPTSKAATSSTTQKWQHSLAPAIAAARRARSEASVDNGSPRNSAGGRKISTDKGTAQRASTAAVGSGLARTGSRPKSANSNAATCAGRLQDAKNSGGGPARSKPALQQWSSRSVSSMNRLGLTRTTSVASGSISRDRSTPENGRRVAARAAAARIISGPDAFPSTRYDAMLLREDPKNLTWLRGCDEGDEGV